MLKIFLHALTRQLTKEQCAANFGVTVVAQNPLQVFIDFDPDSLLVFDGDTE